MEILASWNAHVLLLALPMGATCRRCCFLSSSSFVSVSVSASIQALSSISFVSSSIEATYQLIRTLSETYYLDQFVCFCCTSFCSSNHVWEESTCATNQPTPHVVASVVVLSLASEFNWNAKGLECSNVD